MPSKHWLEKQTKKNEYYKQRANILLKRKLHYAKNPGHRRAVARSIYLAHPDPQKASSRARYLRSPERKREASKSNYRDNPQAKNEASRAKYKANPQYKKNASKLFYAARPVLKKAVARAYYNANKQLVSINRKARYALDAPKEAEKRQFIRNLYGKLLSNVDFTVQLCEQLKHIQERLADMSEGTLATTACRIAAERLVWKALQARKATAGELLKCVRYVNALNVSLDDLGEQCHSSFSEPFFYDSAYKLVRWEKAIAVDEQGRCHIAQEMGERDKSTMRPKKWGCTIQCKLPTADEVRHIIATREQFKKPIRHLREALQIIDDRCQHGHYSRQSAVNTSIFDAVDDNDGQNVPKILLGHPIPCSVHVCDSQLCRIRAASTHFPRLHRFLVLVYAARRYHRQISDVDMALRTADFARLMELT